MAKKTIPSIHLPIQTQDGSMEMVWYLYLQWLATKGGEGGSLPDQTGHSGEFLTTDGTDASWAAAPVTSVNSKTGVVVLSASDVGALPDSTVIPTVNDATITITQGGVTKGSFTLNQSIGDTIALDAGGGGSLPDQTGNSGKFLTTNGSVASWGGAVPTTSSAFKIYATDSDGNQTTKDYTTGNTGSTIVLRSSAGQVSVALTPTADPHATSKKYVDNALANKVSTGHEVIAYQAPTAANNYTWYRKYADGWVEQGGSAAAPGTINLPVEMSDGHYVVVITPLGTGAFASINAQSKTTTGFLLNNDRSWSMDWYVCGVAASA